MAAGWRPAATPSAAATHGVQRFEGAKVRDVDARRSPRQSQTPTPIAASSGGRAPMNSSPSILGNAFATRAQSRWAGDAVKYAYTSAENLTISVRLLVSASWLRSHA